ncbi:MAG: hypothetical protein GY854_35300 [Deltaproteobacteria bacterium]|nr:hypothetical protein [Deltaproteobacteria bacterium]
MPDFTLCEVLTTPDRSYDICVGGVCVSPGCGDVTCNVPGPHFELADTNQRRCTDEFGYMPSCAGTPDSAQCEEVDLCGQDAQYGWDAKNDESERFVRETEIEDQPVVFDNVTSLVWRGCPDGMTGTSCEKGSLREHTWSNALIHCDALSWGGLFGLATTRRIRITLHF